MGNKHDKDAIPVYQGTIDYFPNALALVAQVSAYGAAKYGWGDWRTVPDALVRYRNAHMRHVLSEAQGEEFDRDSGLLHAAHTAWNSLMILETLAKQLARTHAPCYTSAPDRIAG